ncbi:hypothetical protein ANABIO32_03600 [Rossellomorea marisflavi]|nr:hypothetical protein ANABIO32_03600 [Rossellomorea marisflavi]
MTFMKKYFLGYLFFVIVLVMVYSLVPPTYALTAMLSLAIGFALYQFYISFKKREDKQF